ncbi:TPM domain-containing protein [Cognatiyoonia sp. IB215182]|uniref:TPM domain-containing protein n=1 Tax=Cognatiyoonia sp. IB215182 TaxID=3097353 RepID=UPI002A179D75|nr:TPM domain-containing protein [Cognatiyoonia sp. IB215182]MDX8353156.1 TPM domain-containing protein [Cognatiyoonia sp. IB215182]
MIRSLKAGALLLLLSFGAAFAQSFPPDNDFYVNDYADLLTDAEEDELRATLDELFQARDIEFTVLTIPRMLDYGHTGSIESFATALFNYWGIGDADRNDGLLLLVSRFDRELRIEVGAGYGDTLNGPMQRVINNKIVPYFRLDDYPAGIRAGVDEIIFQVTDRYPGEYDSPWIERAWNGFKRLLVNLGWWLIAPFALVSPFVVRLIRRMQRNRPRICPNDGSRMRRYLEETEDDSLSPGQLVEERLESVDYDVWYCDRCDHVTIEGYRAWFSRYGACRECGFRTVEGESRTIRAATYSSTGLREADYNCHHCNAHYTVQSTIPKKRKSSSSSRSGSRGGGRSSGGGASGSW